MYVTCKCSNVSIRTRAREFEAINDNGSGAVELSPVERADEFFREKLATATELEGITKEQPSLVRMKNVGSWITHRCLNCWMYTHAVHREHGAALVLINSDMITSSDQVDELRSNPDYSPVFRVIIRRSATDDSDVLEPPTKFSVSQLSRPLQLALAGLQQQLEEAVQRKAAATDETIRAFTAEQYQLLEQFRDKAHGEYRLLARLICAEQDESANNNVVRNPVTIPAVSANVLERSSVVAASDFNSSIAKSTGTTSSPAATAIADNSSTSSSSQGVGGCRVTGGKSARHRAATKHPSRSQMNGARERGNGLKVFSRDPSSLLPQPISAPLSCFDAEAMFSLEGMDDASLVPEEPTQPSEEDESDTDGHDEGGGSGSGGVRVPRGLRGGHPTLAKSLPVSVPGFPSFVRRAIRDDDDDQLSGDPLDPHNIRASIKALAKSVHGDTVFGDLPRPRFSTQI